jgi:hypothetical protein
MFTVKQFNCGGGKQIQRNYLHNFSVRDTPSRNWVANLQRKLKETSSALQILKGINRPKNEYELKKTRNEAIFTGRTRSILRREFK